MKLIEFKMPKGFTLPEGTGSGDMFNEMATFRVKQNGTLCLVAIGDHKLPGYKTDEKTAETPMNEMGVKASTRYQEAMQGGNGSGTGIY